MMNNNNQIGVGMIISAIEGMTPKMHKEQLKHFARIRLEGRKKKVFLPHWKWDGKHINKMRFKDYIAWIYSMFIKRIK